MPANLWHVTNITQTVTESQSEFVWIDRQPGLFRSENSNAQSATLHFTLS